VRPRPELRPSPQRRLQVVVAEGERGQSLAKGIQRVQGRGADRVGPGRGGVIDADELEVAAIGQEGDPVRGAGARMLATARARQPDARCELGGGGLGIGDGDDQVVDAPDHVADASSIR
jgi:hypothetical protein